MTGYRSILEAYRSREMEAKTRGTVQSGYHPQEQQCSCLQSNSKSDAHENILLSDLLPDEKLHAMQRGSYFVDGRLIWWFISTAVICGGQGEEQETEGAQEENRSNFKVAKKSEVSSRFKTQILCFAAAVQRCLSLFSCSSSLMTISLRLYLAPTICKSSCWMGMMSSSLSGCDDSRG